MSLEAATSIATLVPANPDGLDSKSEGDNHIRMLKSVLQASFPGLAGRLGRIQNKLSTYDLVLNDNLSVIFFTVGSGIQLRTAVSATVMGNGFYVTVVNSSADTVVFDPSGGETVNGAASVVIQRNYMAHLWCDGAAWLAAVLPTSTDVVAPGVIASYAGSAAPSGWLLCNGSLASKTLYPALFTAIGTIYGPGDASNFQLPDLRNRAIFGRDTGGGARITVAVSGVDGTTLGAAGGSEFLHGHTHIDSGHQHSGTTGAESNTHEHDVVNGRVNDAGGGATGPLMHNTGSGAGQDIGSTGIQDTSHNHNFSTNISAANLNVTGFGASQNLPPALILNMIIKT